MTQTGSGAATIRATVLLVLLSAALSTALIVLRAPTATLFGPLLAGAALTLAGREPYPPSPMLLRLSQGAVGVTVGAYLQPATLASLAAHWLPVGATSLATIGVSLLAGWVLAAYRPVDRPTATFSMIPGGASGLTAVSHELGADERLVAAVQYLRVVLVVLTTPVAARLLLGHATTRPAPPATMPTSAGLGFAYLTGCLLIGLISAQLLRLPAGSLLGPLTVSATATLLGLHYTGLLPTLAQDAAFALIGAQIGLRFSGHTLRLVRHVLPLATLLILLIMGGCAGLGLALAATTHTSALNGYLATTPGGLFIALATASSSGANVTFVAAVQVIRLVTILACAPLLAKTLRQ